MSFKSLLHFCIQWRSKFWHSVLHPYEFCHYFSLKTWNTSKQMVPGFKIAVALQLVVSRLLCRYKPLPVQGTCVFPLTLGPSPWAHSFHFSQIIASSSTPLLEAQSNDPSIPIERRPHGRPISSLLCWNEGDRGPLDRVITFNEIIRPL